MALSAHEEGQMGRQAGDNRDVAGCTSTSDRVGELLRFRVCYTDGGEFSDAYKCDNILTDDASCYCSIKKECVNIVVQHEAGRPFVLTAVDVAAPLQGYTSPLSTGIIFVSTAAPDLASTAMFDAVDSQADFHAACQQFEEEVRDPCAPSCSASAAPTPVCFFDLKGLSRRTFHLPAPHTGVYVVIKLLRSKYVYSDNIDAQYVGLRGRARPFGFASGALA